MSETNQIPPQNVTVLVVDDEEADRRIMREALSDQGYEVLTAGTLKQSEELLRDEGARIDLVMLDLILGNEPGEDLFNALRLHAPQAAVVIVSGYRDEETVMRCLSKGACDFLEKPYRLKEMFTIVSRALRRNKNRNVRSEDLEAQHPAGGWVELTAPSDFEFLTRMQRFSQILFSTQLPREVAEDLRMTMEEMGRNAIEWGNRFDTQKQFRISYCFFKDRVVIKFEDEGEGFHPDTLPDPAEDPQKHLENREKAGKRPGGFGVFLVQNIMDEVVYSERGNVVIMTKYLTGKRKKK